MELLGGGQGVKFELTQKAGLSWQGGGHTSAKSGPYREAEEWGAGELPENWKVVTVAGTWGPGEPCAWASPSASIKVL